MNPICVIAWLVDPSLATSLSLAANRHTTNHQSAAIVRPQYDVSNMASHACSYPAADGTLTSESWNPMGRTCSDISKFMGPYWELQSFCHSQLPAVNLDGTTAWNRERSLKSSFCYPVTALPRFMATGLLVAESGLWLLPTHLFRHVTH